MTGAHHDRRPSSAMRFPSAGPVDGIESFRVPNYQPSSRTASYVASSVRTPLNSDLQISHDEPFQNDGKAIRNNFAPMRRTSSAKRILQLTPDEGDKLRELAAALRDDAISAYEDHVHTFNRQPDPSQWKPVKKRDHLVAVKQKQRSWSKLVNSSSEATPTLMAFGSIAGQLEDILYGFSSETSLEMKLQGSYSSGTTHDAAVLSVIDAATLEDPFQFLGVKWMLQSFGAGGSSSSGKSASAKTLMKRRDLMYLESLGVVSMASGERIGYRIQHSVNFKSLAHLNESAVRAKISMCQLYRQRSDGKTVDVFMRGYYDPCGGRVSQMLAASLAADIMLLSPGDALECANLKKLAWCAKQTGRRRRKYTSIMRQTRKLSAAEVEEMLNMADELRLNPHGDKGNASSSCALCHKECSGLLRRSACACMVCSQLVCTRCSVIKKISFAMGPSLSSDVVGSGHQQDDESSEIRQKSLSFCLHCIVSSNRERAFDVAASDLIERGVVPADVIQDHFHPPSAGSGRVTPASRPNSARPRPSSVSHQSDDRYGHFLPTPSSGRRRATTTSGKRLTTLFPFEGAAIPTATAVPTVSRYKAFSVASGTTTTASTIDPDDVD